MSETPDTISVISEAEWPTLQNPVHLTPVVHELNTATHAFPEAISDNEFGAIS